MIYLNFFPTVPIISFSEKKEKQEDSLQYNKF